jgi:proto-oncogene tyrosine-protein kinase ROS
VNLQEIPTAASVVKNNTLYTPQVEEFQAVDDLTQVPRIKREQISLTKFLGSGAFGEVYEGTVKNLMYMNIDTKVAIKVLIFVFCIKCCELSWV